MREFRGLVVHIAEGSYEGTIAWQRNPSSNVSSHFIVARDGRIAQMVDTTRIAWTQRQGNGRWLSVECEGFVDDGLSGAQVHAIARLFAQGHLAYGYPLALASRPDQRGLGHHSMGGAAWGHLACPGVKIIGQKPAILIRARSLVTPAAPKPARWPVFLFYNPIGEGDDMRPYALIRHKDAGKPEVFALFGSGAVRHIGPAELALLTATTLPAAERMKITLTDNTLEYNRLKAGAAALAA